MFIHHDRLINERGKFRFLTCMIPQLLGFLHEKVMLHSSDIEKELKNSCTITLAWAKTQAQHGQE